MSLVVAFYFVPVYKPSPLPPFHPARPRVVATGRFSCRPRDGVLRPGKILKKPSATFFFFLVLRGPPILFSLLIEVFFCLWAASGTPKT